MNHHLTIYADWDEPRLKLVCTATLDAPCRMRPAEDDRESWNLDDPDVTPGHPCYAVEWWEADGAESFEWGKDWPTIPVVVKFDVDHPVISWDKPTDPMPLDLLDRIASPAPDETEVQQLAEYLHGWVACCPDCPDIVPPDEVSEVARSIAEDILMRRWVPAELNDQDSEPVSVTSEDPPRVSLRDTSTAEEGADHEEV